MHMLSALLRLSHLLVFVASPQSPVALVEDVKGSPAGIQIMDYVETGKVIKLGPQDSIVLSYLTSCWRETINGGTVIVGKERSDVDGGMVERSTVACPGNKMLLRAEPTRTSGAEVFRNMPDGGSQEASPQLALYGRSPVIEVRPVGTLVIERIDKPGEEYKMPLDGTPLVHGAFLDLTKSGVVLAAGGIYRAKAGAQQMVFKIDRDAQPGQTPIVGRLVRLQPSN